MEPASNLQTFDRNGIPVAVGTIVRVLDVPERLLVRLPEDEAARVKSMKDAVLSVYEIDQWGSAWVMKWWNIGEEQSLSHSLALAPAEMEVVANGRSDA
jgi:hypothetical protein